MNSYELSRQWFDFSFENPDKVKPNHTAIYFFIIEHCNRLGWKERFGLPTTMAMEALGIKSYNTYIKCFNDIVEWNFVKLIEKSKNQFSSNIIALSKFNKASNKALDKALINHSTKHCCITQQSIDSIDKQLNNITIKQINKQTDVFCDFLNNNLNLIFGNQIEFLSVEGFEEILSPYDFLKKNHTERLGVFEMKEKKTFKDYETFIVNFNSKVVEEEIDLEPKKLFARLDRLNSNWNKNKNGSKNNFVANR